MLGVLAPRLEVGLKVRRSAYPTSSKTMRMMCGNLEVVVLEVVCFVKRRRFVVEEEQVELG